MREIIGASAGKNVTRGVVQIAVEQDRVWLRQGREGQWVQLRAPAARELADLLGQAADEADASLVVGPAAQQEAND